MQATDAILAIATAPGKGGVGVVRFSFPPAQPDVQAFAQALFGKLPAPRYAQLSKVRDDQSRLIDEGLLLYFSAPHSFTGEHVLEFQGHGGPGVLQTVVARALEVARALNVPLRHAQPGEFTQRAFLNNKVDLAQAEAIADLIDASSHAAVKAAAASLSGVFSQQVQALADKLIHLRLLLEATLDFPEEEIDFLEKADARGQLLSITQTHQQLVQAAQEGVKFRDGLQVVLAGQPNVGKSSLLNALAGEEVAIVSSVAGTTRDRIKQELHVRGVPLVLVDTAGLRHTTDEVEQIGIARTQQSLQQADLVLHLIDGSKALDAADVDLLKQFPAGVPVLLVVNKCDLACPLADAELGAWATRVRVSAKQREGLEHLKDEILRLGQVLHTPEHGFMARQRHVDALARCGEHLDMAQQYAQQDDRILDLFAEELRLAHDALGEITGKMLPDDLLGLIFSRFCIGK